MKVEPWETLFGFLEKVGSLVTYITWGSSVFDCLLFEKLQYILEHSSFRDIIVKPFDFV